MKSVLSLMSTSTTLSLTEKLRRIEMLTLTARTTALIIVDSFSSVVFSFKLFVRQDFVCFGNILKLKFSFFFVVCIKIKNKGAGRYTINEKENALENKIHMEKD